MIYTRDILFRVVCNIRIPIGGGKESIGTGMFIGKGNDFYLLTASHVVAAHNAQTAVIFCDDSGRCNRMLLTEFTNTAWVHHPVADLAYIKIILTPTNQQHLNNRFFPYNQINLQRQPISRDSELTSIGFPLGLGAVGSFSPLSFRTFVASSFITLNRFDNHQPADFIILENPSIGGYSGGPIFDLGYIISGIMSQNTGDTICHGFMHGTISDETGGKLGALTPAFYIDGWI
ncbi:MAG: hypothetical protein ACD_35C00117G0001, partial [uncultured bacterium]